jgi:hypothetical protein
MMCNRPDIAYAVGQAACFSQNPGKAHWSAVKRILSYLSGTLNHGILFSSKGRAHLVGFTDADYAGYLDSCKSTSGFLFLHLGCAVAWGSHRQTCTTTSTTEAEYIAASDATKEAIWLRRLLIQIDSFPTKPVRLMCNNQSSIRLVHNPVHHNRTKHIQHIPGLQLFFRTVRCAPGRSQQKVVHKSLQAITLDMLLWAIRNLGLLYMKACINAMGLM